MIRSFFSNGFSRMVRLIMAAAVAVALLAINSGPVGASGDATILVNTDQDVVIATDGLCSLREAIIASNTNTKSGSAVGECAAGTTSLDTIEFDITRAVFQSNADLQISDNISQSSLPAIIKPVIITNNTGLPILVQGWGGGTGEGFTFTTGSAGSVLNGMDIGNWGNDGVLLEGTSGKVTLTNNWIGVYWDGTSAEANNQGVVIQSSYNVIGGLDATGHRRTNVISGNDNEGLIVSSGTGNIIQGNYVGTSADGLSSLGNGSGNYPGVEVGPTAVNTLIGGTKANQGNLIEGNTAIGLQIDLGAKSTKIQRNVIEGNNNVNIDDEGGLSTLIGGTMPQAGNIIIGAARQIWLSNSNGTSTISGNLIGVNGDGTTGGSGDEGIYFNGAPAKTTITSNLISGNYDGIDFEANTPLVSITQNCITGNTNTGMITTGGTEVVANNWWGVSTGPNTPGADTTLGSLTVSPWLKTTPLSCLGWAPHTIIPIDQSFANKKTTASKFSWAAVDTAHDYQFTLSNNANLSTPIDNNIDTGLVKYHTDGPLDYGAYYWQTTTNTADGIAWPSAIHTFYVTTMTLPKPGTTVTLDAANQMTFKWLAFPNATSYTLDLYDDTSCLGTLLASPTILSTSASGFYFGFTPGQDYSWQLEPDNGATMPCWSFKTAP